MKKYLKLYKNGKFYNAFGDDGIIIHYLLGYKYLRSAVKMALEDPSSVNLITKIMYPKIAREYFTTPSRVERSIRTAISSIDIDNPLKGTMFICSSREYPTNKEFIAGVAEYINRK